MHAQLHWKRFISVSMQYTRITCPFMSVSFPKNLCLPGLDYKNVLYSAFMPILSAAVFDNTGKPYDVSKILTSEFLFDEEAFKKYSPIYLPITYVLSYGVQFAGLTALVTHTMCWYGSDIWKQTKESFSGQVEKRNTDYEPLSQNGTISEHENSNDASSVNPNIEPGFKLPMSGGDVHNRLMEQYDDAPIGWYISTFIAMLAIAIFVVE